MTLKPGQRARALVTVDGQRFEADVLMWADGNRMSTVRPGGAEYFERDQRLGPNAWTCGGRLVTIEIVT